MAINDITGDNLISRHSKEYENAYDSIFGKDVYFSIEYTDGFTHTKKFRSILLAHEYIDSCGDSIKAYKQMEILEG